MSFIIDCGAWFVHYRWGALWKLLKVNLFTRLSINISAWYDTWLIESVAKAGAWLNCDGLIAPELMPRLYWRLFSVDASLASYSRIFTKWLHIVFRRAHVSCLSPNNAPINDHWTRPEKKKRKNGWHLSHPVIKLDQWFVDYWLSLTSAGRWRTSIFHFRLLGCNVRSMLMTRLRHLLFFFIRYQIM